MASVAGTLGGFGQASLLDDQGGLLGLTKTLAMEGGRHGITGNAIVPGDHRHRGVPHGERGDERADREPDRLQAPRRAAGHRERDRLPLLRPRRRTSPGSSSTSPAASSCSSSSGRQDRRYHDPGSGCLLDGSPGPPPCRRRGSPLDPSGSPSGRWSCVVVVALGLVFAGSPTKLASGTRIAGVDVGGLDARRRAAAARARSARLERVPVTFAAGGERFPMTPKALGVEVDWDAAVATRERQGGGFGLVRGFRRLELEFFPEDVAPPTRAYDAALDLRARADREGDRRAAPRGDARPARPAHHDRRRRDRPRARPRRRPRR